ncbi:MAG: hypothetical protein KA371_17170 [Acidobacteria bacterium]|nr:hypothetical protein [Acidobacteriota bacterium]
MSKSNVNPNHYKVAGRGRQGEDIAQARNRQKHAESLARRRAERGAAAPKTPAPPKGAAARGAASGRVGKPDKPAQAAMTTTKKTHAVAPKVPPAQKRGHNLVLGRSAPHARFAKTKPAPILRPMGAVPTLTATQARKKASINLQAADKRGKRSTAQKRAASRNDFGAMPATGAVAGAFGKEPSPGRRPVRKK